ncbi:MAG: glycine--tRNA ligase subunit alpha [Terriglobia bacterium]
MASKRKPAKTGTDRTGLTFQDMCLRLSEFWARQGCVLALPYDLEVGAGTMTPETFLRVLGPEPWRVAYLQPSRRPADGRYGENPNRLLKHTQMQVILKPPPADIQDMYLASLADLGIDLRHHDIRFEEDNWEAPTLGAWGIGWQVMLDGLEITQFTYFQQSGGVDLEPISVELTYGLERIAAFLEGAEDVYQVRWNEGVSYGDMRRDEERELSVYDFEGTDSAPLWKLFDLYEGEAQGILRSYDRGKSAGQQERVPLRKAYEYCLKCSHVFNILDARGAISVTERVTLIGRVRKLACEVAAIYLDRKTAVVEAEPA